MYIIIAILIFGLIIAIHEFGHFIAAKAFGVGVPEFAIGMGPKLLKKQGKETLYTLRAIPMGGFCALDGDDNEVQGEKSLFAKPLWKRLVIFLAGSTMNIVAGFLILLAMTSTLSTLPTTTLEGFAPGFEHEGPEGLMVGDTIHSIDGLRVYQANNIGMFLQLSVGDTVDMVVIRDGARVSLLGLPLEPRVFPGSDDPRFGLDLARNEAPTPLDRIAFAARDTQDFMRQLPLTFRMFATGQAGIGDVSSVVGIVDVMNTAGQEAQSAADTLWVMAFLMALISISVAMVNLLPIPGLDGGRIFLMVVTTAIERITRKKVNPNIENYINTAGMVLLFGFMIFIMFNDIVRIVTR
ncbi:MAG: site-2 protease family protein [Oscillospiraceae bacterium]|nr:site-2 protease family protein [Oscillospiraceae bacterium]